jgi:hypothetical protein
VYTAEALAKIAATNRLTWTGRKHSEATIAKAKERCKGMAFPTAALEAARIANTGRSTPWSPETLAKHQARMKGLPVSLQMTEAARRANTGPHSAERTAKRMATFHANRTARALAAAMQPDLLKECA